MQVTRRSHYAVLTLVFLSGNEGNLVPLDTVSKETRVPRAFLSKVVGDLVSAGLVYSRTGPGGGCRLAKQPADINLREVIEAVEGKVGLDPTLSDDEPSGVWLSIDRELNRVLEGYTIEKLVTDSDRGLAWLRSLE